MERYLELRRRHGEKNVTDSSPLFRDIYDPENPEAVENPRPIRGKALGTHFARLWDKSRLRNGSNNGSRNFEFKALHFMRKYFHTNLEPVMSEVVIKKLRGDHAQGVTDSYYRFGDSEELFKYPYAKKFKVWHELVDIHCKNQGGLAISEQYRDKSKFEQKLLDQKEEIMQRIDRTFKSTWLSQWCARRAKWRICRTPRN